MQKPGSKSRFFDTHSNRVRSHVPDRTPPDASHANTKLWTVLIFAISIVIVVAFLYLDRNNAISSFLRSWGKIGIVFAIILKTLITATPVPTEGILIIFMKIYGVWWGVAYSWIGGVLSSFLIFVAARHVGRPLLKSMITTERFHQVDNWVKKRGILGLLFIRMLPIPGFISSYILGTIPSVKLWPYVWTEALSVIPYYIGTALIFLGVSAHMTKWLSVGGIALVLFWGISYLVRKKYMA